MAESPPTLPGRSLPVTPLTPGGIVGNAAIYPFLIGLAGPISDVVRGKSGPIALPLAALAVFAASFVAILQLSRNPHAPMLARELPAVRRFLIRALTVLLLGIATATLIHFGSIWWVLFIYVATTTMFVLPVGWELGSIAGVLAVMVTAGVIHGMSWPNVGSLAISVGLIGFVTLLMRRRGLLIRQLSQANDEVARLAAADAVTEERLRFARDLHDLLGHSLSVIALKTELARRLHDGGADAARVHAELCDIEQITRRALGEVREAVTGYRAGSLTSELARARAALEAADVTVTTQIAAPALSPEVDDLLAWIVREATTNIVRHSQARRAEIAVSQADGVIRLDVHNDGVAEAPATAGSGLAGLRERVEEAGGRLTSARDGARFHVSAIVPAGAST